MLHVLYIVAIIAEAMTAALVAGRKQMDWFGVCVVASITALGGGTVRDVLLGHYPLTWIRHPEYLVVTVVAALAVAFIAPYMRRLRKVFLTLDAVGLVVFTIIGCNVALALELPLLIVVVAGMVTGCAGGVLRDLLCGQVPLLFQKELYASVSLLTGALYLALGRTPLLHDAVVAIAMVVGFVVRMLAIRYEWNMPRFVYRSEWD
ncbi:trimeric intracellular cation channel family protein [Pseudoxanthomonas sp. SL93]|uniref:trimeric intracellular cation channel family protein n=1 Tax=Pseudoxanthomonas sp. SL93 TaxID=2995142 RepID=UPI00226EDCE8|nr:trimeric intracellular cation channel family protein [Pseudoxanthomonas sp. SL93]WAC63792.1 trimeric intracellular cation channel family protein [Pseudoxanthomonas sp. SL93]